MNCTIELLVVLCLSNVNEANDALSTFILPAISSFSLGLSVPTPTLPLKCIVSTSRKLYVSPSNSFTPVTSDEPTTVSNDAEPVDFIRPENRAVVSGYTLPEYLTAIYCVPL